MIEQSRRCFLATAAAAAAGLLRWPPALAAEGALETTSVRLVNDGSICIAPEYAAEDLLRAEGFTDIRYLRVPQSAFEATMARREVDFSTDYAAKHISTIDAGVPIVVLAGVHAGCFELFAREGIRNVADLKGKKVGLKEAPTALLTLMAAQVGLDPDKDLRWITDPKEKPLELFAEGKIDAFLGFPPEPQRLRAQNIGHVIVNSAQDRPWSQYFCCMLAGNREFVRKNPMATKRLVRAMLRATDLCVSEPALVVQRMVDRGFTPRRDYAVQTLADVPYNNWREYDPEDTIRFYALRLREAGMLKSSPAKIVADGADWRFLNEVRRDLGG